MTPLSPADLARLLGQPPPTPEQAAVIAAPLEPGVVIAGAGSGKTETMSARVVWLVANGHVRPDQILGLTFTRKAASELAHRVRRRLAQLRERGVLDEQRQAEVLAGEPTVATYNSYAVRILREHSLRAGVEPPGAPLTEAGAWQVAERVVSGYDGSMDHIDKAPSSVTQAVLGLAGEMAEHLVTPDELRRFTARLRAGIDAKPATAKHKGAYYASVARMLDVQEARLELLPLVEAFEKAKRARAELDFGDQMSLAARVAAAHPEVGRIERERFAVVLLDEYQDTGHAQRLLLTSLFGGGHPVVAVGDPCQSIYAWRGASAGNLARFPWHFPLRDGSPSAVRTLSVSFRNGERILDVANRLSEPLRAQGYQVPTLSAGPAGLGAGVVECAVHRSVVDEAESVADRLAQVWSANSTRRERGEAPWSVAVLVRKRSQIPRIESALQARGLPVEVVGVGGLLSTPEVSDVVATLRVLVDVATGAALMRLLTGPRWRIGPRDLAALSRWSSILRERSLGDEPRPERPVVPAVEEDGRSIIEALDEIYEAPRAMFSAAGRSRLLALSRELRDLRGRVGQPLPDLVADVIRLSGLDVELMARSGNHPSARAHLDAFLDVVTSFAEDAQSGGGGVSALLAYLDAAEARERGLAPGEVEVAPDAIQILTVHGAKGLEWDTVVVPGLCEGLFPSTPDGGAWLTGMAELPYPLRGDAADLPQLDLEPAEDQKGVDIARERLVDELKERDRAEERRLVYVAATRARHLLLCSGYRWDVGTKPREPAGFLAEIRDADAVVTSWADEILDGEENPVTAEPVVVAWPFDPLGDRRSEIAAGAALVEAARLDLQAGTVGDSADEWDSEVTLLLAERAAHHRTDAVTVQLPEALSVSRLVALRADPEALARELRRPLPRKPAPLARRGTAFHAWLEQRFGSQRLLDVDELPGARDETAQFDDLPELRRCFEASEWADRTPAHVEVPFEMVLDSVAIRGRMDAVFRDTDGCFDVVDWKTGDVPSGARAEAAAVQLAAYRVAWSKMAGVPLEQVRAAFHYVRPGRTVRPVDLLDEEGLIALLRTVPTAPTIMQ